MVCLVVKNIIQSTNGSNSKCSKECASQQVLKSWPEATNNIHGLSHAALVTSCRFLITGPVYMKDTIHYDTSTIPNKIHVFDAIHNMKDEEEYH